MTGNRTKHWYLKNLDVFSHMREEEHRMIAAYSNMREIKRGEVLYLQGSSDKNLYMLKKGAVKVTRLTPNGREVILDIIKGGSIFGEMSVVDAVERDESAEVIEDGLLCDMTRADFDRLLRMVPGLSIRITRMIGLGRWKLENKLLDMLYGTVEQRFVKTLPCLLDDFGLPDEGCYLKRIKLTHKDYADLIASTRETVTATINKLKAEGVLDCRGRYIFIPSVETLERIAAVLPSSQPGDGLGFMNEPLNGKSGNMVALGKGPIVNEGYVNQTLLGGDHG